MYPAYSIPDPASTPLMNTIEHLDNSELKKLLNDDDNLIDLILDSQQVKDLKMEREVLMATNKSLAEENLSFEPHLQSSKKKLAALHEKVAECNQEFESAKSLLDSKMDQNSLETTLALLQTAAAEIEEETEIMSEKFLEGGMEIEEYLEKFLGKRMIAHLRKIKAEKMKEIMRRPNRM